MNLKSLIDAIAGDLNDNTPGYSYQTWTADQIREWVTEGESLIYDKRPDLFMERKIIQVEPCSIIQDTCECDAVRRVIGQVSKSGRLLNTMRERGLEISFQWTGKSCVKRPKPGQGFRLESYAVDTVSGDLYVWPEIPLGIDVYIEVECSVRPTEMKDTDEVSAEYYAAIKQWALWRAKSMDMEISSAAMSAAQVHYKAFFDLLGLPVDTQVVIHKKDNT